jgi:histone-lysine N-methyltransferase SETDB1
MYDASTIGNLGRFFNHSCNPNIGVQNTFIEHQDPRFPRVSFFTIRGIKAGDELCWNYGYIITQNITCNCKAANCSGFFK